VNDDVSRDGSDHGDHSFTVKGLIDTHNRIEGCAHLEMSDSHQSRGLEVAFRVAISSLLSTTT